MKNDVYSPHRGTKPVRPARLVRKTTRGTEEMKIECARRHFGAIEMDYDMVSSAQEMREEILETHSNA